MDMEAGALSQAGEGKSRAQRRRRAARICRQMHHFLGQARDPSRPAVVRLSAPGSGDVVWVCLSLGAGCFYVPDLIREADVPAVYDALYNTQPTTALFKTQSVDDMDTAPMGGDHHRLAGPPIGDGPGELAIRRAMRRSAQLLSVPWRPRFVAREASVLVSLPGACQQLTHADAPSRMVGGDIPAMVGVSLAVQPGTRLIVYPSLREVQCTPWGPVVPPFVAHYNPFGAFFMRGDLVHAGALTRRKSKTVVHNFTATEQRGDHINSHSLT